MIQFLLPVARFVGKEVAIAAAIGGATYMYKKFSEKKTA